MKVIESIGQLKKEAEKGCEFTVVLNGGLRSGKYIWYNKEENVFEVFNEIDGTDDIFTPEQMCNPEESIIGKALEKKALLKY